MALESGKVATGDTIQASDFNKLRNDLLTNHTHASGEGGVVDHADLTETGDMSEMGHRHEDIDVHLLGSGPGPNSIDSPGGEQGVHGLASVTYVAGALNSQWVIDAGQTGSGKSGTVNFTTAFSSPPRVVVTPVYSSENANLSASVHTVTTSSFQWVCSVSVPLNWIAVGTKT